VPFYYHVPLYRKLNESSEIDLTVYYCSDETLRGEEVEKTYNTKMQPIEEDLLSGYKYKFLKNYSSSPSFLKWPFGLMNFDIWNEVKVGGYDAIVIQSWTNLTWWVAFCACLICKVPVLFMTDSNILSEPAKPGWKITFKKFLLGKFLFKNSAGFLTSGKANEDFYRFYGVPDYKMTRIPFSWGYEKFLVKANQLKGERDRIRELLGIKRDEFVILYVGRLSKEKMPMAILDAYKKINNSKKKLFIVGDGPMREKFEKCIKDYRLDNVILIGFQPHKEVSSFYAAADVLVLPSEHETWGIVVNEAMCFGLPIIVSDRVGAGVDLVRDGYNGFIFPVGNVEKFSGAIEKIINLSESNRQVFRQRSFDIISKWVNDSDPTPKISKLLGLLKDNSK